MKSVIIDKSVSDAVADSLHDMLQRAYILAPAARAALYEYRTKYPATATMWHTDASVSALEAENIALRQALTRIQKAISISRAIIIAREALKPLDIP